MHLSDNTNQADIVWAPRETVNPQQAWQNKAAAYLFETYKYLLSPADKNIGDD
ncbi:hypothetical protein [uncultured Desulfobacter sp.]|uniref:hypothetical protein n=1 Tax=uncultured Desulfobacter sp. TaxID=240139 RepID=UPI002AA600A6|nr:hypothetical protein [uncultured Desulfobacter sp.]